MKLFSSEVAELSCCRPVALKGCWSGSERPPRTRLSAYRCSEGKLRVTGCSTLAVPADMFSLGLYRVTVEYYRPLGREDRMESTSIIRQLLPYAGVVTRDKKQ